MRAEGFLSFDSLTWRRVPPGHSFIVGPNASGKTNLLHVAREMRSALVDATTPDSHTSTSGALLRRHGLSDADEFEVSIDIEFDTGEERGLMADYVRATLWQPNAVVQWAHSSRPRSAPMPEAQERAGRLCQQMMTQAPPQLHDALCRGTLGVRWAFQMFAATGYYEVTMYYRTEAYRRALWCLLNGDHAATVILPRLPARGVRHIQSTNVASAWLDALDSTAQEAVRGFLAGSRDDPAAAGLPPIPDPDWPNVLDSSSSGQPIGFEPVASDAMSPAPVQRVCGAVAGILRPDRGVSLRHVLANLVSRGMTVSGNRRNTPHDVYSASALWAASLDMDSGRDLALYLWRLANGAPREQVLFGDLRRRFARLSGGAQVRIQAEPAAPPSDKPESAPDIRITTFIGDRHHQYVPLRFSAAGHVELLYLSALLTGAKGRVVILDEPGANLHRNIQKRLLQEITSAPGQRITVTHSPDLLPAHGDRNIWRMHAGAVGSQLRGGPKAWRDLLLQPGEVLARASGLHALLFHSLVVLVDGAEEEMALPVWYAKWHGARGHALADMDVGVFGVGGKGYVAKHVEFLLRYAVPWCLLADGDALCAGPQGIVTQLAQARIIVKATGNFNDEQEALRKYHVFVLGLGKPRNMTQLVNCVIGNAPEAPPQKGEGSKPARALWAAQNRDPPLELDALFREVTRLRQGRQVRSVHPRHAAVETHADAP